jgi:alkylhydroperoxidase/carboxymuconolactone decarboxylase family protein YurZ
MGALLTSPRCGKHRRPNPGEHHDRGKETEHTAFSIERRRCESGIACARALHQRHYTKGPLLEGRWKRPEMSPRDRSIVTVAALIARLQTIEMPFHFALALENGVKPSELSEIITHLAFYSGWANAMSAVSVAKNILHQRGIGIERGHLEPVEGPINDQSDDAYPAKYKASPHLPAMISAPVRTATVRIAPRAACESPG